MMAAAQPFISGAISKTINLPRDCDPDMVSQVYWEAYWSNCKGITVYRDGCRDDVAGMKQPMKVMLY